MRESITVDVGPLPGCMGYVRVILGPSKDHLGKKQFLKMVPTWSNMKLRFFSDRFKVGLGSSWFECVNHSADKVKGGDPRHLLSMMRARPYECLLTYSPPQVRRFRFGIPHRIDFRNDLKFLHFNQVSVTNTNTRNGSFRKKV